MDLQSIFIMGNNKNTNRHNPTSENVTNPLVSRESSDSEPDTQQPTSSTLLNSREVARGESDHGRFVSFRH